MKIAFIAHQLSGDIEGNLKKITEICRKINLEEPDTVPFAPYFSDLYSLDDNIPEERARGIRNDMEFFERHVIDELRLYGDRVSSGMADEILIALREQIEIIPMTEETKAYFKNIN